MNDPLVGKRAAYTHIVREWHPKTQTYVELERKTFHGTIAALLTVGSAHCAVVVMLYDDGSLRQHDIAAITIEGDQAGPFRWCTGICRATRGVA